MFKLFVCLSALVWGYTIVIAQESPYKSHKELLLLLKSSKPDSNRIQLQFALGNAYLDRFGFLLERQNILSDSAITLFKEALFLSDSLQLEPYKNESLCLLGCAYLRVGELSKGKDYYMEVIKKYQKEGNKQKEARVWEKLGFDYNREERTYTVALEAYRRALELYRELDDKDHEAGVMLKIADHHFAFDKVYLAEKELSWVLDTYKNIGHEKLYDTYYMLSVVNRHRGDFDKALLYAQECIKNMEKTKDVGNPETFYGELAMVYQELGQHEESIKWYRKDLELIVGKNRNKVLIFRTAGLLALQLIKGGKAYEAMSLITEINAKFQPMSPLELATMAQNFGYCHEALEDYPNAEKYFLEMIDQYGKASHDDGFQTLAYRDAGNFFLKAKKNELAQYFLNKATVNEGSGLPRSVIKDIYLLNFRADSTMGNYLSAIESFQKYKSLNDTIFNDKRNKQIEELQVKYETAKKESEIQQLTNNNFLQQNKLKNSLVVRNSIISAALILIGIVYYRYLLKQKTNKLLEHSQIEIAQKNRNLERLVSEKEWLVKEIHHRVKNNYQMVMGLLGTQSGYLKHEEALMAIKESKQRIQAMSIIHQKLYQSNNLSAIHMRDYVPELVEFLKFSYDHNPKIKFSLQIEQIILDHTFAIPLGLILNEAITNSLKYAFIETGEGTITISLRETSKGQLKLVIGDNGIGIPERYTTNAPQSMGLNLIKGLCEDIGGHCKLENKGGTRLSIIFPSS